MAGRPKKKDYTWLSVHMSERMKDAVLRVAQDEDRAVSSMARLLIKEALRARGVEWEDDPIDRGE